VNPTTNEAPAGLASSKRKSLREELKPEADVFGGCSGFGEVFSPFPPDASLQRRWRVYEKFEWVWIFSKRVRVLILASSRFYAFSMAE
jgi:hypothetical protein